jgi:hypothetical protein
MAPVGVVEGRLPIEPGHVEYQMSIVSSMRLWLLLPVRTGAVVGGYSSCWAARARRRSTEGAVDLLEGVDRRRGGHASGVEGGVARRRMRAHKGAEKPALLGAARQGGESGDHRVSHRQRVAAMPMERRHTLRRRGLRCDRPILAHEAEPEAANDEHEGEHGQREQRQ